MRVAQLRGGIASLDVLLMFAGWGGLLTAVVALATRGEASAENDTAPSLLADESSQAPMMGAGFLLAVLFLVVMQKCHHLWTAPYFDEVARRDGASHPLVHRLVVVSQVFEVLGLFLMTGAGLLRASRARLLLLLASSAWVARALLLSWLESAPPDSALLNSSPLGVSFVSQVLFASQALYGLGIVGFLGALGTLLYHSSRPAAGFRVAFLLGASTGLGVLIGGGLADVPRNGTSAIILLGVISLTIFRRLIAGISNPSPERVQLAVKVMLLSLVTLDATIIFFVTPEPTYAVLTAALIIPARLLAGRIPMT